MSPIKVTPYHEAIYKTEKTQLGEFLNITRNILETMARHADEIEKMIHVDFDGSMSSSVPQESRHTILLYHQVLAFCVYPDVY